LQKVVECFFLMHLYSFKVFLFIVLSTASARAETLKCHFRTSSLNAFTTPLYTCSVQNNKLFRHSRASIDAIDGQHAVNMTNDDVQGLSILSIYNMKFLPTNIERFFAQLILLHIWNTDYEEIHQRDIKGFSKLKYLFVGNNQLRTIEGDLFSFNGDLEFVWMNFNKIARIDPLAFSHLTKLRNLKLFGNECVNSDMSARSEVVDLVRRIEGGMCNNTMSGLDEQELVRMRRENDNLRVQYEEMNQNWMSLRIEMKMEVEKNENLVREGKNLRENLEQVSSELMTIKQDNEKLTSSNEILLAKLQKTLSENELLTYTVNKLTKSVQQLQANYGMLIRRMREKVALNDQNDLLTDINE
jgi:Leucine-rich repeat (LRR) protein